MESGGGIDGGGGMGNGVDISGVNMMAASIGACAGTKDEKCGVGLRRLSR